jgi:hypothetical protein
MPTPFVGRQREIAKLEAALASGGAVLVSGEPGIGKSRLVEQFAEGAHGRGAVVAFGRAWEAEGTPALWPWLEILRALAVEPRTAAIVEEAREEDAELAALLGRAGATADSAARFRLFDAVAQLLRRAAGAPLLVVLEDLHAADAMTLELAVFVMRTVRRAPLLVVGTSRDASFARTPEIAALLEKVAREAEPLALGRLTREDVSEWVATADAERIYTTSEGNPLFVAELLASGASGGLPLGIRGAIRAHLELLPPRASELLTIASVLGRDVTVDGLRALGAELDALGDAGSVLIQAEGGLRFSHALLRDELYARLPATRRAELHGKAALALSREPALAAPHALRSNLDGSTACGIVEAAMAAAAGRFAFADAVEVGERALSALPLGPVERARLWIAVGEALNLDGQRDRGKAACRRAADTAAAIPDPELLARAALAYAGENELGRFDDVVDLLRCALDALPDRDDSLRAQVLATLGLAMIPARPDEGDAPLRLCRDALAMARRVGDATALFASLRNATITFPEGFDVRERFALNAESIALARRLGRVPHVVTLFPWQVATWLELGNLTGAQNELAVAEQMLAPYPHPQHRWRVMLVGAMLAAIDGRFAEADAIARQVLQMAREHDLPEAVTHVLIHAMSVPYLRDAPDTLEFDALMQSVLGRAGMAQIFLSLHEAAVGRVERARAGIELARSIDLRAMPGVVQLGWVVVRANLVEHAPFFYELACATGSPIHFAPGAVGVNGLTGTLAGRLAAMLGNTAEAREHYGRARAFATQLGASALVAQIDRAQADLGDRPRAERDPTPALAIERRGEMWSLQARGRAVLVRDAKGLAYLEALVRAPHREVHVLELARIEDDGDAGPLLDERARRAYKVRVADLRAELEQATHDNDSGRAEREREELDALAGELSRSFGLGGRERRAGSIAERARINVQRRLKDAIRRVREHDPELARHLHLSVKTGNFCMYAPTWP